MKTTQAAGWQKLCRFLAVLALVVFVLSYPVVWLLTKDGQLIQRVIPTDAATSALFGETGPGTPFGEAGIYLINDPAAFLPGAGENGERYVSQTYLDQKGIYPLQTKTVWFFHFFVALVSGLGAVIFGVLWWFLNRRNTVLIHRSSNIV